MICSCRRTHNDIPKMYLCGGCAVRVCSSDIKTNTTNFAILCYNKFVLQDESVDCVDIITEYRLLIADYNWQDYRPRVIYESKLTKYLLNRRYIMDYIEEIHGVIAPGGLPATHDYCGIDGIGTDFNWITDSID